MNQNHFSTVLSQAGWQPYAERDGGTTYTSQEYPFIAINLRQEIARIINIEERRPIDQLCVRSLKVRANGVIKFGPVIIKINNEHLMPKDRK